MEKKTGMLLLLFLLALSVICFSTAWSEPAEPAGINAEAGSEEQALKEIQPLMEIGEVGETEGMSLEDEQVTWTEPLDNRKLECIVQLLPPGEKQRTKWISHKLLVEEPEEDWEW